MRMLMEKEGPKAGEPSFSRSLPMFCAGILVAVWLGVVGWMAYRNWSGPDLVNLWEEGGFGSALTWGRDLLFVTVLPYLGSKLGKIGQRNGSDG